MTMASNGVTGGSLAGPYEQEAPAGMRVVAFFDEPTFSVQYVLACARTRACAIIDPVLDFDPVSGRTGVENAQRILDFLEAERLEPVWILDTHPHADHFSAAGFLRERIGAPTGIGAEVVRVQKLWRDIYGYGGDFRADGSQWDRLFADGELFAVGDLGMRVMHSPGHTLASITYVASSREGAAPAAFIHDTLFMPDFGTARCDFPGGDARRLWRSIADILALPDDAALFTGHDYMPGGRAPLFRSTVALQKERNVHLRAVSDENAFVAMREARDATLALPKLMLSALQVNIAGGRLPEPEANGKRYLKIPLDAF